MTSNSPTPAALRLKAQQRKAAQRARIGLPADVRLFIGAPGTGKSYGLMLAVKAAGRRVVLWDPRHEYELAGAKVVTDARQLAKSMLAGWSGPWIVRPGFNLKAKRVTFDQVCQVVIARQSDPLQPRLTFAVEECAEIITSPGHPPEHLAQLAVQSRHYGVTLLLAGQRPVFVDTTMRGSATSVRCGRLAYAGDCRVMGEWLNVDPKAIQQLPDRHGFVMERGAVTRF